MHGFQILRSQLHGSLTSKALVLVLLASRWCSTSVFLVDCKRSFIERVRVGFDPGMVLASVGRVIRFSSVVSYGVMGTMLGNWELGIALVRRSFLITLLCIFPLTLVRYFLAWQQSISYQVSTVLSESEHFCAVLKYVANCRVPKFAVLSVLLFELSRFR